ncbi:hypothetical protein CR513_44968, partial [Mucuna pruriens]
MKRLGKDESMMQIIYMSKNYYTMIFLVEKDYKYALFKEMWMIEDHYLLIWNLVQCLRWIKIDFYSIKKSIFQDLC